MWFNKENVTPLCPFYICIQHTHTHKHVFGCVENLSVSLATLSISGQLVRVASSHTCYGNSQIKCRSIISLSRHSAQQLTVYWITYQRIKFFGFISECQMFAHCPSICPLVCPSACLSLCRFVPVFVRFYDCPFLLGLWVVYPFSNGLVVYLCLLLTGFLACNMWQMTN